MKKIFRILLLLLCIMSAIVFISYPIIILNLVVDEEPVKADVIIVPEGGNLRAEKAAKLYFNNYSKSNKIIVSPLNEKNIGDYKNQEVPKESLIAETEATSTYTNAVNTLAIMEERNFDSAIVVTSDYHTLRTKQIYERINKNYEYELTFIAAFSSDEEEDLPWFEYNFDIVNREFVKIWGYWLGLYKMIDL